MTRTFIVREYYLNETPPKDFAHSVKAANAVDAIRTVEYWRHAYQFTHRQADNTAQAHTQDGDGRNGCEAKLSDRN